MTDFLKQCLQKYSCGTTGVVAALDQASLTPYVDVTFNDGANFVSVGNLSSPFLNNTAVIKSADIANRDKLIAKVKATPLSSLALGVKEIETATKDGRVETLYLPSFRLTTDNVRSGENEIIVLQLPEDIMEIMVKELV